MKTNKWLILLLLVFCQCANENKETLEVPEAPEECETIQYDELITISCGTYFPEVSDKYIYPIVPGTVEWQQVKTLDDAYQVSQLPDDVLKSISTPGLIDALIHAHMFIGFYFFTVPSSNWIAYYVLFNSAIELYTRKDAGKALTAYYKLVKLDCILSSISSNYGEGKEEYRRLSGLECLFTKQEILDTMDHETKKEAVASLLAHSRLNWDWVRICPMAHIMLADQYEPIVKYSRENVEEFNLTLMAYGYPSNPNQYEIIVSFAKDFINVIN